MIPGQKKEEGPLPSRRKSRGSFIKPGMEVTPDEDYDEQYEVQAQQQQPRQKKVKIDTDPQVLQQPPALSSSNGSGAGRKSALGLGLAPAPQQQQAKSPEPFVCALCPDMSADGLVKIGEPGVKNKKGLSAHRVCVMFTRASSFAFTRDALADLAFL